MLRSILLSLCLLVALGAYASGASQPDPYNATYRIGQESIKLVNGKAELPAAQDSASKRIVSLLSDQVAYGELTGDGLTDAAVILVDQPGGSGSFYYLAVLPGKVREREISLPAVFLGDRIRVEEVKIAEGRVSVTFLERQKGEPMSTPPSVKVTASFAVQGEGVVPTDR